MKIKAKDLLMLLGIAGAVIALDQWTKWLVEQKIPLGEEVYPIGFLAPFFRFTFWKNTGAAFGLFQSASMVLLIVSCLIALLLIWIYFKSLEEPVLFRISLSMMLGGAIGNIIDRLTQGFVTDFIAVGRFPVFNVADSSVTIGVGLMLLALYLQEKKQKPEPEKAEEIDEN